MSDQASRRPQTHGEFEGTLPAAVPQQQRTDNGHEYRSHDDYTVGWVCALPLELGAATGMLDEEHEILTVGPTDSNTYTLGRIGYHNVVLACLPNYGIAKAAVVASHMLPSFPKIQIGLMVGIGGGVPRGGGDGWGGNDGTDIRLGDIVVGDLIVQYDLGKTVWDGRFERTGGSGRPPPDNLATAVKSLRGRHNLQPSRIPSILSEMLERNPFMKGKYARPTTALDKLFETAYDHPEASHDGNTATCDDCDISRLLPRPTRVDEHSRIHYGKIASGNQVVKHGKTRDRWAHELGAVCFEMEAAGLVDANFPCLVIRGISDYADSHKNNQWQGYAAAAAAAYAKELLAIIPPATSQHVLPVGMLWQSLNSLPSTKFSLNKALLQSISNNEAELRHHLTREHGKTRSAILTELQTVQFTLCDAFAQFTINTPLKDSTSPSIISQRPLSDAVPPRSSTAEEVYSNGSEIVPMKPTPCLDNPENTDVARSQLKKDVETLDNLGRIIQTTTEDMKGVSERIHYDVSRVVLKIRRAERLLLRTHPRVQKHAKYEDLNRRVSPGHPVASVRTSTPVIIVHRPSKLKSGNEFNVGDDNQPVPQTVRKSKPEGPPASPTGGSFALAEPLRIEYPVEELRAVNSATTVSTDTAENRLCIRSSMDADYIMTDDIALVGVTHPEFDSHTISSTSSIRNYIQEEGHTYHSYGWKDYMLPNDESWRDVEEILHHVLHTLVLEDKALLCSAPDFGGRVLDVGTGTGIWAIEMANDYPRAEVTGIDLSPIQPTWLPPNCIFFIDDIVELSSLVFPCSDYNPDVVHCRNMTMAIYDWSKFVAWIKRELRPEGSVEFQELLWCPCIQDDGIVKPYTGPLAGFFQTLARAFSAVGVSLDAPRFLKTGLEQADFKDVVQKDFLIPLGSWPKDPERKKIGLLFYKYLLDAIESLSSRVLRRGLNYWPDEARIWAARFREALRKSHRESIVFQFIVVHGRKV